MTVSRSDRVASAGSKAGSTRAASRTAVASSVTAWAMPVPRVEPIRHGVDTQTAFTSSEAG